ncbi:hypothetical protein [Marmoricola sp. URHA0025 HA25]
MILAMSLMLAMTGSVMLAESASAEGAPPAPTVFDPSGTDQDAFTIPVVSGAGYMSLDEATYYTSGATYPSGGVSQLQLKATSCDGFGSCTDTPFTLVFNQAVTGTEAANKYHSVLGACDASLSQTRLTAYIENVADATGRYLPEVSVTAYNIIGSGATLQTMRVLDGETRVRDVKGVGIGVAPGTNTVKYYLGEPGASAPVYTEKVWVPACGSEGPPIGDPGATPVVKANPRGMVRLANCRTGLIKGYTSTKDVRPTSGMTTFKYRKGMAKPIVFKMRNGVSSWKVKYFRHVPNGVVVKLWYKKGRRWLLLAKNRNFGC